MFALVAFGAADGGGPNKLRVCGRLGRADVCIPLAGGATRLPLVPVDALFALKCPEGRPGACTGALDAVACAPIPSPLPAPVKLGRVVVARVCFGVTRFFWKIEKLLELAAAACPVDAIGAGAAKFACGLGVCGIRLVCMAGVRRLEAATPDTPGAPCINPPPIVLLCRWGVVRRMLSLEEEANAGAAAAACAAAV